ncbi:TSUP family transporter [bacterium]|nr:TSUP family transporter [bacterium]
MDYATFLPMLVLLLLIGAATGVIAGLLGVGGGIVLVPAFFYLFGKLGFASDHLMQVCIGTSAATIVVTSIRSVLLHNKKGAVDWAILKSWAPFMVLGSLCGVFAAIWLKNTALQAVFGGLAMMAGLYMAFGRAEWRLGAQMPTGPVRAIEACLLAFCSALMGIGGGTFGVPLMTLYSLPIHRAVATAAGFGLLISIPSLLGFLTVTVPDAPPLSIGAINLPAFFVIIPMTLLTTPYGVSLAHSMNPKPLKRAFALFIVLVGANMLRKAAGW